MRISTHLCDPIRAARNERIKQPSPGCDLFQFQSSVIYWNQSINTIASREEKKRRMLVLHCTCPTVACDKIRKMLWQEAGAVAGIRRQRRQRWQRQPERWNFGGRIAIEFPSISQYIPHEEQIAFPPPLPISTAANCMNGCPNSHAIMFTHIAPAALL